MKILFSTILLLCTVVASHAAKAVFNFDSYAAGTAIDMSNADGGSATVVSNPYGTGRVLEVQCRAYNSVPLLDISLPDGITLGDCTSISVKMYIPSTGNEQYANYKQMQIYVDGDMVFKNVKSDGSDEYPNQGNKDSWIVKTYQRSSLTLSESQRQANSFILGIGLNDNKMKYYIAEVALAYDLNLPDPVIPEQGAYYTGRYRNIFAEAGYTEQQIQSRIDDLWHTYFEGNTDSERLYYESGTDMAYILDVNNNDVRTEGMSYGMMICLQLDKKKEFDALWKWAKTYMQYPDTDERRGYFSWQCGTDGSRKGNTPASDGEEYFVMALMFASHRWGDGEGIFNYSKEANYILEMSKAKPDKSINPYSSYTPLFNQEQMQVVFVPYASAAKFTDPSYHLPAFYELWSKTARSNRDFYSSLAAKSREMWPKFANPTTGLMPDYANFDGTPHQGDGDHSGFLYDAWRCAMNMAVDFSWFRPDDVDYTLLINRLLKFFVSKGITEYHSVYTLEGQDKNGNTDHSPGLVACNASAALACDNKNAWSFVENFYDTAIPTGRYRYYDGCLYFLNWLNCAGRYRIYTSGASTGIHSATPDATLSVSQNGDGSALHISGADSGSYSIVALTSGIIMSQDKFTGTAVDISHLPAGVYALRLEAASQTCTLKFLKY